MTQIENYFKSALLKFFVPPPPHNEESEKSTTQIKYEVKIITQDLQIGNILFLYIQKCRKLFLGRTSYNYEVHMGYFITMNLHLGCFLTMRYLYGIWEEKQIFMFWFALLCNLQQKHTLCPKTPCFMHDNSFVINSSINLQCTFIYLLITLLTVSLLISN